MVHYLDPTRGWIPWIGPQGEQFYLHDRVMVTENDYEADVRNGDLGTITEVFDGPDGHGAGAAMDVEGRRIPLIVDVLSSLPRLRRDRTQSPGQSVAGVHHDAPKPREAHDPQKPALHGGHTCSRATHSLWRSHPARARRHAGLKINRTQNAPRPDPANGKGAGRDRQQEDLTISWSQLADSDET